MPALTDVYSNDRQHLLIPAGSKLLGETKKVDTFGQTRLAVVFHRVLMPDGYSVSLDQFKGLTKSAIPDCGTRSTTTTSAFSGFRSRSAASKRLPKAEPRADLTHRVPT